MFVSELGKCAEGGQRVLQGLFTFGGGAVFGFLGLRRFVVLRVLRNDPFAKVPLDWDLGKPYSEDPCGVSVLSVYAVWFVV